MSTMGGVRTATAAAEPVRTRPDPRAPASPDRDRPPLHVVPKGRPGPLTRRRRARLLAISAAALIVAGMFAVVGAHVVLTQRQFRLDTMTNQLSQATIRHDQLQLQVAQLESPSRIVATAEKRLHMVVPPKVVYLQPGSHPGATKVKGTPAPAPTGTPSSSVSLP